MRKTQWFKKFPVSNIWQQWRVKSSDTGKRRIVVKNSPLKAHIKYSFIALYWCFCWSQRKKKNTINRFIKTSEWVCVFKDCSDCNARCIDPGWLFLRERCLYPECFEHPLELGFTDCMNFGRQKAVVKKHI